MYLNYYTNDKLDTLCDDLLMNIINFLSPFETRNLLIALNIEVDVEKQPLLQRSMTNSIDYYLRKYFRLDFQFKQLLISLNGQCLITSNFLLQSLFHDQLRTCLELVLNAEAQFKISEFFLQNGYSIGSKLFDSITFHVIDKSSKYKRIVCYICNNPKDYINAFPFSACKSYYDGVQVKIHDSSIWQRICYEKYGLRDVWYHIVESSRIEKIGFFVYPRRSKRIRYSGKIITLD